MFGSPPPGYRPNTIDLPETQDRNGNPITRGTTVRSFDFPWCENLRVLEGADACYLEGTVVGAVEHCGSPCYAIQIARRVVAGTERETDVGDIAWPPINGLQGTLGGKLTDGVEVIPDRFLEDGTAPGPGKTETIDPDDSGDEDDEDDGTPVPSMDEGWN